MNPMLAGSLAGAGLGILKSGQQQDQWRDQAYLSALSNVYAPLFGKAPDASLPSRPDSMQTVLDFGLKGAAAGEEYGKAFPKGTVQGAEAAASNKSIFGPGNKQGVNEYNRQMSMLNLPKPVSPSTQGQQLAFDQGAGPVSDSSSISVIDAAIKNQIEPFGHDFGNETLNQMPLSFGISERPSRKQNTVDLQEQLSRRSQIASPFMQQAAGFDVPQYKGRVAGKDGKTVANIDEIINALNFLGGM